MNLKKILRSEGIKRTANDWAPRSGIGDSDLKRGYEKLQSIRRDLTSLSSDASSCPHPAASQVEDMLDAIRDFIFDLPEPR